MDKVVSIVRLKEQQSGFAYWETKSPQERLTAIELLRNQYIRFIKKDAAPRLQSVCRVVRKAMC